MRAYGRGLLLISEAPVLTVGPVFRAYALTGNQLTGFGNFVALLKSL